MDSSRRVDINRVSGRQNRIAGRGKILSQSWAKNLYLLYIKCRFTMLVYEKCTEVTKRLQKIEIFFFGREVMGIAC